MQGNSCFLATAEQRIGCVGNACKANCSVKTPQSKIMHGIEVKACFEEKLCSKQKVSVLSLEMCWKCCLNGLKSCPKRFGFSIEY